MITWFLWSTPAICFSFFRVLLVASKTVQIKTAYSAAQSYIAGSADARAPSFPEKANQAIAPYFVYFIAPRRFCIRGIRGMFIREQRRFAEKLLRIETKYVTVSFHWTGEIL